MNRTLLAGGCSFTFGHELSDDESGKKPSSKTWSALLANEVRANYFSVAYPGTGNAGIARRVFEYITNNKSLLIELKLFFSDINSLEIVKDDGVKYLIDESWKITGFDNINISILVDYNLL